MTLTYANREVAVAALKLRGYKEIRKGVFIKRHFVATIHPVPGSDTVRVMTTIKGK